MLDLGRLTLQHFSDQILRDRPVASGELHDETLRVGVIGQRDRREPQARGPPLRSLVQQRGTGVGQFDSSGIEKLACLSLGEAQVGRADLGQPAGQSQPMQVQLEIATRGQDRVNVRRKVRQQASELAESLGIEFVQVVNHQGNVDASIGELRQHSVNHRLCVEIRRRSWRFRTAGCARSLTDRAEQGKPESPRILPIALHLDHGEPTRLPGTVSPGTQERRLAAPGWRRDDRDLTRRRAIESGEKVNPVDQPRVRAIQRHGPALAHSPDNPPAVDSVPSVTG